jgi:hypothetical protein
MNTSRRPLFFLLLSTVVVTGLSLPAAAQSTDSKPAASEKTKTSSSPQKPVHRTHTVITNDDSIVRLAERSAPQAEKPAAGPQSAAEAAKEPSAATEDPEQKKAEIAALEKQIKEKQRRVELLMRLFVTDEKSFLKDPLNPSEDAVTQERRRYEQDELLWETAEVVKLRAKLDSLKAAAER